MAVLTKQQVKDLIDKRPDGVTPKQVVDQLVSRGNTLEGLNDGSTARRSALRKLSGAELEAESAALNRPSIAAKLGDTPLEAGGKAIANVPSSIINLARGVGTAVVNPIQTVKGLGGIALGGAQKLIGGVQKNEQQFDAFVDVLKNRYGSLDALQLTATNDPFGFGTDVLGGITAAGRIGAARGAQAAGQANKVTLATLKPVKVVQKVKDKAGAIAVGRMDSALKLNPSDKRYIAKPNVAGQPPSEWLVERGIAGNRDEIIGQLTKITRTSKDSVDSGLAALAGKGNTYDINTSALRTKQALETIKTTYGDTIGNEALIAQIDDVLARGSSLELYEINNVKRLLDRNVDIFRASGDVKAGAISKGLANVRDDMKVFIEKEAAKQGFTNVAELNKDTQVARAIKDAIIKREAALSNNRGIGLTDIIVGTVVGGTVDLGTGAAVVIAKKILEDPKVQTNIAKALNRLSKSEYNTVERALTVGVPSPEATAIITRIITEAVKSTEATGIQAQPQEDINSGLRTPLEF